MNKFSEVKAVKSRGEWTLVDDKGSVPVPKSIPECAKIIAATATTANIATFIATNNTLVIREMNEKLKVVLLGMLEDGPAKSAIGSIVSDLDGYLEGLSPKAQS
jgi:hypothetical protein